MTRTDVTLKAILGEAGDVRHGEIFMNLDVLSITQLTNFYIKFARSLGFMDSAITQSLRDEVSYAEEIVQANSEK